MLIASSMKFVFPLPTIFDNKYYQLLSQTDSPVVHATLLEHDGNHVNMRSRDVDVDVGVNRDQVSTFRAPEVHL